MIPAACKRLAEVDFPIAEVSKHAAREKSIRHGHPSTLHLWWARRPLASSRAVLMALLLPDPCDAHCPSGVQVAACKGDYCWRCGARAWWVGRGQVKTPTRGCGATLLRFIADFANWDNAAKDGVPGNRPSAGAGRAPGGDAPGGGPLRGRRLHSP